MNLKKINVVEVSLDFDCYQEQQPPQQQQIEQLKQKEVFFQLSGIHPELPSAEIAAILESENFLFQILEKRKQCLIVRCSPQGAYRAAWRAAYCRRAVELLVHSLIPASPRENISKIISKEINFNEILKAGQSFLVRVYRIGTAAKDVRSMDLESAIGKVIWEQTNGKHRVNVATPSTTFVLLFLEDKFLFGKEVYARPKGVFAPRRADLRPFFKPGTMDPQFARLLVNLAKASPKRILLDPFCGPGGILIEGALIGCRVLGSDIDRKMIKGARRNLEHYAPTGHYDLFLADAKKLPIRTSINAIATDPPYGRSTSTFGKELVPLLKLFLEEAATILTPGGAIAISIFEEIPLKEIVEDIGGLKLDLYKKIYIHKSLTRRVGVCRKK